MTRLVFKPPFPADHIVICKGQVRQYVMHWQMAIDTEEPGNWQTWMNLLRENPDKPSTYLEEVLDLIGLPLHITIGPYTGTIRTPTQPPQDWTHPNGSPLPDSWHWEWIADPATSKLLHAQCLDAVYGLRVLNLPSRLPRLNWIFS
jgi:hypothetical protein